MTTVAPLFGAERTASTARAKAPTYAALDGVLALPPGSCRAAARSDMALVGLAEHLGLTTVSAVREGRLTPAEYVEIVADSVRAELPALTPRPAVAVAAIPAVPAAPAAEGVVDAATAGAPTGPGALTDVELATALGTRLLHRRHRAPVLDAVVKALMAAMPELAVEATQ